MVVSYQTTFLSHAFKVETCIMLYKYKYSFASLFISAVIILQMTGSESITSFYFHLLFKDSDRKYIKYENIWASSLWFSTHPANEGLKCSLRHLVTCSISTGAQLSLALSLPVTLLWQISWAARFSNSWVCEGSDRECGDCSWNSCQCVLTLSSLCMRDTGTSNSDVLQDAPWEKGVICKVRHC